MTEQTDLERCLITVGPRLTAAAAGLTDERTLARWRNGTEPIPVEAGMHLNVARRFVDIFMDSGDTAAVAAAYMRGSWPDLDGRAPIMVIREGGFDEWDVLLGIAERVARDGGGF